MCIKGNYSAITVSDGEPSFGHAAFKTFPFDLKKEHLRGIDTCCKHPCMIHIWRPTIPKEFKMPGTWTVHEDKDLFGHFIT